MCELFGLSCNAEDRAIRSLSILAREYSPANPDGWGLAWYRDGRAILHKAPERALDSPAFAALIAKATSSIFIAHMRLATKGSLCERNCHPFTREALSRSWVFAHNGTVEGIARHPDSSGDTDSEQVFNLLLDAIADYRDEGRIHGTFSGVKNGIRTIFARYGRGISLNFLLSDGTILYAFSHHKDKPVYYLERTRKVYGGAFLVATAKLTDEPWETLPRDRLLMVCRGQVLELSERI